MNPDEATPELLALRARVLQLEVELQARDAFIIAAAHELRNPISPLMLHVQRLAAAARKAGDGAVSAGWLRGQLETFSSRLTRFLSALNRILDVSSIQSGKIQLISEPVDLSELTRDVAAGFERELEASKSQLSLQLEVEVLGRWDRMRLEQVVSNLLSNAIRYGDSQPIEISLRRTAEGAELCVIDRGVGIAEADQARIFHRFERAHTQYRSGFGVGLWMVHQLCEAMGGSVGVTSSAGEGSTFRVVLPTNLDGSDDDR